MDGDETMTPDRLQAILATLHWSQRVCGIETGYDESTVRRWLSTHRPSPIPESVAAWMEKLEAAVLACGRPTA
jgi:hypothetical protein